MDRVTRPDAPGSLGRDHVPPEERRISSRPTPLGRNDVSTHAPGVTAAPRAGARVGLEIVIVMALTLGRSAVYSVLSLLDVLTRPQPMSQQITPMNVAATPDRPWLSLSYQVATVILPLAQVLLVLYLLHVALRDRWLRARLTLRGDDAPPAAETPVAPDRPPSARRLIGFDLTRPGRDLLYAVALFAGVGLPGLGFYLLARQLGLNTAVSAANLGGVWWAVPALIVAALMAGLQEEVIMLGYLLTRLEDLRWNPWAALMVSAVIRGSYHLYQGWGGALGNLVMGLVFGWCYQRWGRVLPLVLAHTFMDIAAFVGYAALAPHVGWL